jgi:hypothetical protein
VLAVGVDKYARKDWKPSYAVKDASSFAPALKSVEGPLFGEPQVEEAARYGGHRAHHCRRVSASRQDCRAFSESVKSKRTSQLAGNRPSLPPPMMPASVALRIASGRDPRFDTSS